MRERATIRRQWICAASISAFLACSPDAAKVVGTWVNREKVYLTVEKDLRGQVYQLTACARPLTVKIHRDPFDSYSIQFDKDQTLYFPPRIKSLFGGAEFFCSSADSDPMCSFCRIDGKQMTCTAPEQKITGFGATVQHDCVWTQVSTSATSSVTANRDAGISCPALTSDAGGCSAMLEPVPGRDGTAGGADAGVGGVDASAADTGRQD
jgi:hypothetical protein